MDLCNYNWNISILRVLQNPRIHTTDLGIEVYDKYEDFGIGMEDMYGIWFGKGFGRKKFEFVKINIKIEKPDILTLYYFTNKYMEMAMRFYIEK